MGLNLKKKFKRATRWAVDVTKDAFDAIVVDPIKKGVDEGVEALTGYNPDEVRRQAQAALDEQRRHNETLEQQMRDEQERARLELQQAEAQASRDTQNLAMGAAQRKELRKRRGQAGGRSSTIVTNPLGLTGTEFEGTKRTLLGG